MAESSSQVTINDVPEYMKPYRQALLNAAFGLTFTPEYIQSQGLNMQAGYQPPPPAPQFPPQPPPGGPPPGMEIDPYLYTQSRGAPEQGSLLGRGAAGIEQALRGRTRYTSGGRLSNSAQEIEDSLLPPGARPVDSDVWLGPGGTTLGGPYEGLNVNPQPNPPGQIGTGTQTPPPPAPPSVTPPAYAGPNGVVNTPASGSFTPGNPNPAPPRNGGGMGSVIPFQPGGGSGGSAVSPQFVSQRPGNFAGAQQAAAAGYNPAQYADDSVAQDLAGNMGANVTYTNTAGPIGPPSQATLNFGGEANLNAGLVNDAYTRYANDPGMLQQRMNGIRDEIRSLGGTPGFKKGGVIRAYAGTAMPSFDALNPYVPFNGPRTLSNGANFGQVGAGGTPQISDLSRTALTGYGNIPSAFDSAGNIDANRNAAGEATSNYGIANDTFNTSGQLALDASRRSGDLSYNSPLTSSFQDTMNGIRSDPSRFQAGDISLGELTAGQVQAPLGVSPSRLTSYQMAGPNRIDMSGSNIDPAYIQGGGTMSVGRFIDPGVAGQYMSPYQQQVNEVRRRDAERAFQEQRATRQAQAVRAGAFGGSREAVASSLAEREMLREQDRITAEGQQEAYENAQQQYERDRGASMTSQAFNADSGFRSSAANQAAYMDAAGRNQGVRLQAALANQAAMQEANRINLGASLDVQQLGANQSLTAQQANQQAGSQAGLANLQAFQQTQNLARTTGLDAARSNQNTRLTQNQALLDAAAREDQLRQQAQQGNFSSQLQAMGQETNSALAANTIGQSGADLQRLAQATELQRLQQQQSAGAGIDSRTQGNLDMAYQDFINQRNYPYQQLNWLQGLYSGVPQGFNQEQVLFNRTNPAAQIGGLATAGLGAVSSYLNRKKGGMVKAKKA